MDESMHPNPDGAIAIIGMSGRFPGARDVDAFWRNIREGVESVASFTDEELEAEGVPAAVRSAPGYVKAGAVLDGIDEFDASFFGYSPREAELMDPQQRLFLEHAWGALENAGHLSEDRGEAVGVFGGASPSSYLSRHVAGSRGSDGDIRTITGNNVDFLCTRVSYKLGLKGPSVVVQTSCSTSLVAVHLACQSLLGYETDMALAGGVSVNLPHRAGYHYVEDGIYSPDGHCRPFDAKAAGTVGGNGVGVVVLKRLADAIADGDRIRAVILGSAINNDGSDKIGFTAPSVSAQAEAIASAHAVAGVSPRSIGYVESHGTGTRLGDPIEMAALCEAFRAGTSETSFCHLGTLKANVGHLDAAAGVAGLIKAALVLEHATFPPNVNFDTSNPEIDLDRSPFLLSQEAGPWGAQGSPRRAAVSSFGMGGTNAHVVLEEAPMREPTGSSRSHQLLALSAKTPEALETATDELAEYLENHPELTLADIAYTLQVGRRNLPYRRAIVCEDRESAVEGLRDRSLGRSTAGEATADSAPIVFLFPGQGAQHVGMARGLYESESVFRQHFDRCSGVLEPLLGRDVRGLLYPDGSTVDATAADSELRQTAITQPALFAVEYALAQLWGDLGIRPRAMLGHSIGEYVAACLAGVLSLEDALALVAGRGKLMQSTSPGSMLAVQATEDEIRRRLRGSLSIAALNAPGSSVVSGPTPETDALRVELEADGIACQELRTSHAFHSEMMEPIVAAFVERVSEAELRAPSIPFVSNLTGTWITDEEATDPEYWGRHLRGTVRFADGAATLLREPRTLLEVGPGRTLSTLVRRQKAGSESTIVASLPHPRDERSDVETFVSALGRLWVAGANPDWAAVHRDERRGRVPLPTYPFESQRHWIPASSASKGRDRPPGAPTKVSDVADWFYEPSWRRSPSPVPRAPGATGSGVWLLFADVAGLAHAVADRIAEDGADVVMVRPGDGFARVGGDGYLVDPRSVDDYASLLDEIESRGTPIHRVVHMWTAHAYGDEEPRSGIAERMLEEGFHSLLALVQALDRRIGSQGLRLDLITANAQDVSGLETLCPEASASLGLLKVVPLERPDLACRSIDLAPASEGWTASDVDQLWSELRSEAPSAEVALRGPYRWERAYEHAIPDDGPGLTRENGTYLITGGLGGIGLEFADFLAIHVRARLVLVSRRGLPDRGEWAGLMASDDTPADMTRRIQQVLNVEAHGGEVLVLSADATDPDDLAGAFREAEERFGEIHGVIHAAGAPIVEHPLGTLETDEADRQFRPKTHGLLALSRVLEGRSPDFCLVVSSLSSALGAVGFGAYTAAHAFADAFAARQARGGATPWITVNWDNWYTWRDGEADPEADGLVFFMTADEGRRALEALFRRTGASQLLLSTGDLGARYDQWVNRRGRGPRGDVGDGSASYDEIDRPPRTLDAKDAPRSKNETILAEIWAGLLGIDDLGVHDDFFELGGDSVIGIQMASRAAAAGLRLSPRLIFEHPTIAGLAEACDAEGSAPKEDETVAGPVLLTPVQRWFFERDLAGPHHFNLPAVAELKPPVDAGLVAKTIEALVEHHDALRLGFKREADGWKQSIEPTASPITVKTIELADVPEADRDSQMAEEAGRAQAALDLENGPRMRVLLFDRGDVEPATLLWVVHHLLLDVVSWRVLHDDFEAVHTRLVEDQPVQLPPKTTSYKSWAEHLRDHAASDVVGAEVDIWSPSAPSPPSPLPRDRTAGANTEGSARVVSSTLDAADTEALLRELPQRYRAQVDELLLASLARSLANWTGESKLLIDMENHGREAIFDDIDLSRTVGWFTAIFPVLLDLGSAEEAAGAVRSIKDSLRRVPNGGIGYGLLRYMSPDDEVRARLSAQPRPEISFLYLGQFRPSPDQSRRIRWVAADLGAAASPANERTHVLQALASVRDETLHLECIYSENLHRASTIERLIENWATELRQMVASTSGPEASALTPSDFPGARVSKGDLDKLVSRIGRSKS